MANIKDISTTSTKNVFVAGDHIKLNTVKGTLIIGPGLTNQISSQLDKEDTEGNLLRLQMSGEVVPHGSIDDDVKNLDLDFPNTRYVPLVGDFVLALMHNRISDYFVVDINASCGPVLLPHLSFEGVTNRNKPNLNVGDLLLCQVCKVFPGCYVELTCVFEKTGKADGMGLLSSDKGMVVRVSPRFCRKLMSEEKSFILSAIGQELEFECAIGVNGRIWINSTNDRQIFALYKLFKQLDTYKNPLDTNGVKLLLKEHLIQVSSH